MKRIILSGANGAMGHEIAACINNRDDCKIVAGLDINTNVYSDFPIYNNADELTCGADVMIDFSHVSVLTPLLAYATKERIPVILLPIAFKLLKPEKHNLEDTNSLSASTGFATAIKTIIIADAAMGIDNVLAIAGVAHGNMVLVLLGLAISIPIVVWGSQIISNLMDRLPILITLGSAILAYTSASMILHDKIIGNFLLSLTEYMNYILPVLFIGAIIVYSQKVAKK